MLTVQKRYLRVNSRRRLQSSLTALSLSILEFRCIERSWTFEGIAGKNKHRKRQLGVSRYNLSSCDHNHRALGQIRWEKEYGLDTRLRTLLGFRTMYFLYEPIGYFFFFWKIDVASASSIFPFRWKRIYAGNTISLLKCHEKGDKDRVSLLTAGKKSVWLFPKLSNVWSLPFLLRCWLTREISTAWQEWRNWAWWSVLVGWLECFWGSPIIISISKLIFLHWNE